MPETRKYTVVDLFAGVGGLSYGFSRNDRFEIILANEMQKDIAKAYTLNHPAVNMLQGDIKDLSEDILRQAIGIRTVDVVVGGPPCQSYSTLGKRQMDARANLFMEYKRVLRILHPRAFLFENVKGILSMDKGILFEHVRKEFEDIGYSLQYKILNAVDYGVPQLRERVILVGFLGENDFQYPEPTHGEGLLPYVTLQDALKDLPALACGEENTVYGPSDYRYGSGYKAWWVCNKCGLSYQSPINVHIRGHKCPYCSGQKVATGKNDLQTLYPKIAREYSDKNSVPVNQISAHTHHKAIWNCPFCGNEYTASINHRTSG